MLFPLSKRTKDSNGPRDLRHPEHGAGSFGTSQEALSMGNGNPNKEKQWRAAWSGGIEHRLKLEGLGSNLCFASFYLGNMRQIACLSFPWQCPHLWTLCPLAWPGLARKAISSPGWNCGWCQNTYNRRRSKGNSSTGHQALIMYWSLYICDLTLPSQEQFGKQLICTCARWENHSFVRALLKVSSPVTDGHTI